MTTEERIRRIRIIDQIKNSITYSEKLGLSETSFWKSEDTHEVHSSRFRDESFYTNVQERA